MPPMHALPLGFLPRQSPPITQSALTALTATPFITARPSVQICSDALSSSDGKQSTPVTTPSLLTIKRENEEARVGSRAVAFCCSSPHFISAFSFPNSSARSNSYFGAVSLASGGKLRFNESCRQALSDYSGLKSALFFAGTTTSTVINVFVDSVSVGPLQTFFSFCSDC